MLKSLAEFSREFDLIKIGLASPERILMWSHGEVEKPETINYRTFKPERRGLFCEKIFGPVKDWECHCGKYRRVRYRGIVCERCGVEVTTSRVRRERMGHIKLSVPVSHVWFLRGIPSYMGLLLDIPTRPLEEVIYYDAYVVTDISSDISGLKLGQILREVEYQEAREQYGNKFKAEMGAKPIKELLSRIDLAKLVKELRKEFKDSVGQKRMKIIKRLRVAESFLNSGNRPEWMIFDSIPVLPPDLRPMVQLEGGRFATSDLNDLYRRILNRNNRLKKMISMGAPDMIVRNEKRMLQEAVDVLIDNGRRRRSVTGSTGKPLKSLTDIIEGKEGRFRQNLLGKRADYSGRSVIVVGPTLKMHQCGLPKEMALELFKPFVIRKLVERGFSQNVKNAKRQIEKRDVVVWDMLEEVIKGHPVLLNRAPTLHRLGIQAFEPILVEGKAIQIHPLVCPAFNADFDGDQMAVHVPLLTEAQLEAKIIMMSSNNILSPASGRPVCTPTQDMVVGSYYMTVVDEKQEKGKNKCFSNEWEAMIANDLDEIALHALIKVRMDGKMVETTVGRIKFNYTLKKALQAKTGGKSFDYINETVGKKKLESIISECHLRFGSAATAEIADEVKRLGFKYGTLGGITIAVEDLKIPDAKKKILDQANKEVEHLEKLFSQKLISATEKFIRSLDIWGGVTDKVTEAMLEGFDKLNSVYMMVFSGARGSLQQVRQLAGIRGLMADPSGNIINIPIKTNFKEGLNITEYFISSYGARKGLVDTALRTADSGYLTRRLVDVAQDVVITEDECGSENSIAISGIREGYEEIVPISARLVYRTPVSNVIDPISKKVIAKAGEEITEDKAKDIYSAGIESVNVRSTLTCKTKRGLCKKCYGRDLSSAVEINLGEAVGIIAAQSIGEPGTQLTMRTFHIGGVALHKTSVVSIKARHAGKVKISDAVESSQIIDNVGKKVSLVTREAKLLIKIKDREEEYIIPVGSILKVSDGDTVEQHAVLAEFDPAYEYVASGSAGKVKFLNLEIIDRERKISDKVVIDHLAKNDAEVFVYNPKLVKEVELEKDIKAFVKVGSILRIGDEIAPNVTSKVAGHVINISSSKGKDAVDIAPGEVYSILAGSRMHVNDGENIKDYQLISTVETIRRDPSKTRDIIQGLPRVEELFEARRPKDPAILSDIDGEVEISEKEGVRQVIIKGNKADRNEYVVPYEARLKVARGDKITKGTALTYGTVNSHDVLRILGVRAVQIHLVDEIQKIYRAQGVTINDKHIEVIVRQLTKKVRVFLPGATALLPGELIDKAELTKINKENDGADAEGLDVLLGITKASLSTDSFISAASFQETARVLTDAAVKGKTDEMYGLKENVIIGKLIPAGTGFSTYRFVNVFPSTSQEGKKE